MRVLVKISHRIGFNNSIDEQANIDRLTETVALQFFFLVAVFVSFSLPPPAVGHTTILVYRFVSIVVQFSLLPFRNVTNTSFSQSGRCV